MELGNRWHRAAALLICVWISVVSLAHGGENAGFIKLNSETCTKLDEGAASKLPYKWQRYKGVIRSCGLRQRPDEIAKVSIIAVWVDDYYAARPSEAAWQDFPKPLIVDEHGHEIGTLPELYPSEDPREADVYYGKWQLGMPMEIRVDIHNPAVSGDYYYPPIIFNKQTGKYMMDRQEVIYGRRRK